MHSQICPYTQRVSSQAYGQEAGSHPQFFEILQEGKEKIGDHKTSEITLDWRIVYVRQYFPEDISSLPEKTCPEPYLQLPDSKL